MSTKNTFTLKQMGMNDSCGEFEMDEKAFFEDMIIPIMNAKPGTLAYEVRDDWARLAVEINVDKL